MANDVTMRWRNRSSAAINATLQLLVIYRHRLMCFLVQWICLDSLVTNQLWKEKEKLDLFYGVKLSTLQLEVFIFQIFVWVDACGWLHPVFSFSKIYRPAEYIYVFFGWDFLYIISTLGLAFILTKCALY